MNRWYVEKEPVSLRGGDYQITEPMIMVKGGLQWKGRRYTFAHNISEETH